LSVFLNTASDEADVTSLGRPFQTFAPATGKARRPTVDRRQVGTYVKPFSGGGPEQGSQYARNLASIFDPMQSHRF